MVTKIFQTIPKIIIANQISILWTIPIFGQDDQVLTINLKLISEEGDAVANRRFQILEDENKAMKQQIILLKRENDELLQGAFLTRVLHQDYIIENMYRMFAIMSDEQKEMACALFDFKDEKSLATQRLYRALMPWDSSDGFDNENSILYNNAYYDVFKYLSNDYIDSNYMMKNIPEKKIHFRTKNDKSHTFFSQLLWHVLMARHATTKPYIIVNLLNLLIPHIDNTNINNMSSNQYNGLIDFSKRISDKIEYCHKALASHQPPEIATQCNNAIIILQKVQKIKFIFAE